MPYTVGSLFAGIGGFDLGFELAGFEVAWQVEIDPWARKVLSRNFPFPCQDISHSGNMQGIDGERSGLWREYKRILRILRPRYALIENVAALVGLGLERVLCDLAEIGFDAEWQVIPASGIGATHRRERVWILAYPGYERLYERRIDRDALSPGQFLCGASSYVLPGKQKISDQILADCFGTRAGEHSHWMVEPGVARVANGLPHRMDRIRGLGNAVVPQIPEMYARRILAALEAA